MKTFIGRLWRDEAGATMVEYALMLGLIAAVCISTIFVVGNTTDSAFSQPLNRLSDNGTP